MTPSTTSGTPVSREAHELIARAMKLPSDVRERFARQLVHSVHPELDLDRFGSPAELVDYLRTNPTAVVETP